MAVKIAGLWVDLQARIAKFTSDMDKAGNRSRIVGVAIGNMLANLAQSVLQLGIRSATAFPRLVKGAIDTADALSKTSQKIGISVETLSGLKHGAELAGTSLEGLQTGVARLSGNILDASLGMKTSIRAFKALDVQFKNTDGTLRSTDAVLFDIADRFAGMEDGTKKTALAMDLLGRSGAQAIPLLNLSADGLRANADEAAALGKILDTQTAQAAEQFNDDLDRMAGAVEGVGMKVAAHLLPNLVGATEKLVAWLKEGDRVDKVAAVLAGSVLLVAQAMVFFSKGAVGAIFVGNKFGQVLTRINILALEAANVFNFGMFTPAIQKLQQQLAGLKESEGDLAGALVQLELIQIAVTEGFAEYTKLMQGRRAVAEEDVVVTEDQAKALAKYLEGLKEQNLTLGLSVGKLAAYSAAKLGATLAEQGLAAQLATGNELGKTALELVKERGTAEWIETTFIRSKIGALKDLADATAAILALEEERRLKDLGPLLPRELPSSRELERIGAWASSAERVGFSVAVLNQRTQDHADRIDEAQTSWERFGRQVSTVLTNMAQGIGDAIVNAQRLGEVGVQISKRIASALIAHVIERGIKQVLKWLDILGERMKATSGGGILGTIARGVGAVIGLGGGKASTGQGGGTVTTAPSPDDFAHSFGLIVDAVALGSEGVSQSVETSGSGQRALSVLIGNKTFAGLEKIGSATVAVGVKLGSVIESGTRRIVKAIVKGAWIDFAGQIIGAAIGAFTGGGGGGGMQHGGRPMPGFPQLVGEAGPEWFIPDTWGTIVPNTATTNLLASAVEGEGSRGSRFEFLDTKEEQPGTTINIKIDGVISDDKLDRVIEKISRRIKYGGIVLESTAGRAATRRRS